MGRNEDPVLARLSRSRTGLNSRHNVVIPLLGNDNKINSDRRTKPDSMLGAAVNSPGSHGWRLAASSLMAYWPFPDA